MTNNFVGKWKHRGRNVEISFDATGGFTDIDPDSHGLDGSGAYFYDDAYLYFKNFKYKINDGREFSPPDAKLKYTFINNDSFNLRRDDSLSNCIIADGDYDKVEEI